MSFAFSLKYTQCNHKNYKSVCILDSVAAFSRWLFFNTLKSMFYIKNLDFNKCKLTVEDIETDLVLQKMKYTTF